MKKTQNFTALMTRIAELRRRLEQGNSSSVQFLIYTMIMVIMVAFLYDMSHLAVGVTMGRSALTAAAQEAGKNINAGLFADSQYVVLDFAAMTRANQVATSMSNGRVVVNNVVLADPGVAPAIKVNGTVLIPTPSLAALFGINGYTINMSVTAAPTWGIENEGS
jgi:hypothetical protein